MMKNREIHFVINTPSTHEARADEVQIRSTAVAQKISHATNLSAAEAIGQSHALAEEQPPHGQIAAGVSCVNPASEAANHDRR